MKSCPTCNRQYAEETMKFCLDDGALLIVAQPPTRLGSAAEETMHLPAPRMTQPASETYSPQPTMTSVGFQPAGVSGQQISGEQAGRPSRAWLWVVLALIIGGSAMGVALIVMRGRLPDNNPVSQPTPSLALASPTQSVESDSAASTADKGQVNLPTEKQTPLTKATPFSKPTPVKMDVPPVKEEPPAPPPAAPRAPISGGVMNGKAVRLVTPQYPPVARSVHASGAVQVQVLIDENGDVISAHAISGHPLLQAAAVSAARSSKFTPTRLSGQPVKVNGVIVYNFASQ